MRIAHIGRLKATSSNGVDRTIRGLALAQRHAGHEVEIWHFDSRAIQISQQDAEAGIRVLSLPTARTHVLTGSVRKALMERRSKFDIVHAHSVFIPEQIQAVRGFRYVITPNGGYMPNVLNGRNRILKRLWCALFEWRYIRSAHAIHAVSHYELDVFAGLFPKSNVFYLPNGIDQSQLDQDAVNRTQPPQDFRFLGRLAVQQKGLDLLLQAYARSGLKASGFKLLIAGPDFRGGLSFLENLAEKLGISDSVEFLGELKGGEASHFLSAPSIFIHPSRWEGMPFSLIEALAHGLPAITTPGTNLSEEISQASAGWCCPADVDSLAAAMKTSASEHLTDIISKRENAQSLIRSSFTWDVIGQGMLNHYKKIVSQKDGGRPA